MQPLHITFPQHDSKVTCLPSKGSGNRQRGHSSGGGGSLNNCSSCNSATLLSQAFLCFVRCFFLHAALQYVTDLHLLHVFRLVPCLPHAAQVCYCIFSDVSSVLLSDISTLSIPSVTVSMAVSVLIIFCVCVFAYYFDIPQRVWIPTKKTNNTTN